MTAPVASPSLYADFGGLADLKRAAQADDPQALREAARQFESLFARQLLSSMRAASFGDSLFGSSEQEFYQGMFDDQLAVELTRGPGLGLADLLVEQLTRAGLAPAGGTAAAQSSSPPAQPQAWQAGDREAFLRELWPHAEAAGRALGVDPRLLVAHAALETGWGRSMPCGPDGRCSFNLFGIKAGASWIGPAVGSRTLEFEAGVPVARVERFRAYDSPAASFADYVALLRDNPRYADTLGTGADAQAFATALQRAGYATDPAYAGKLTAVARSLEALAPSAALNIREQRPIRSVDG